MEYVIKSGDWLSKIAQQYDMSWQELYDFDGGTGKTNRERLNEQKVANNRPEKSIDNPDLIYPEDIILVPDEPSEEEPAEEPEAAEPEPAEEPPQPELSQNAAPSTSDLMRPSYQITIGSEKFDSKDEPSIISIKATRAMGLPTDGCEVKLVGSKNYKFKKEDNVEIQLGYDDKLSVVFNGIVNNIEQEYSVTRVNGIGSALGLLRLRLNRVYLSQTAGNIVSDLAKEAGVKMKTVSDGISLPVYVVDDGANAIEHILKLAERCNYNTFITDAEELEFKAPENNKTLSLSFGKDIIRVEATNFSPLFDSARICGESPSSIKGSDTSHWLTKQEVKGESGSGTMILVQDLAIKDNKTAETVAKSKAEKLACTFGWVVEVLGNPEIKLGENVSLEDMPNSELKGPLEVRGIEHYLSKNKGFTTKIDCRGKGESP